ncbi:zinc-finger protein [Tilletia horrida]|nr:zinc-finger protein [Tilletia horrida]
MTGTSTPIPGITLTNGAGPMTNQCSMSGAGGYLPFCNLTDVIVPCSDPTHLPPSVSGTDSTVYAQNGSKKRTATQMLHGSTGCISNDPSACSIDLLQAARCPECTTSNPQLGASLMEAVSAFHACTNANCGTSFDFSCCPVNSHNSLCHFGYPFEPVGVGSGVAAGGTSACCEASGHGSAHGHFAGNPHKKYRTDHAASVNTTATGSPSLASVISTQPSGLDPSSPSLSSGADARTAATNSTLPSPMHLDSEVSEDPSLTSTGEDAAAAAAAAALLASGLRKKKKQMSALSRRAEPSASDLKFGADKQQAPPSSEDGGVHVCRWKGCNAQFPNSAELTTHLTEKHVGSGKSEYVCQWEGCERNGRVFAQRQKLCRHLQSHTGDRPHECHICHKRFTEGTTLTQHIRAAHTTDRPYKCDFPGCNKAFSVAGSLTIHKRTHSGEKPFKCPFAGCDKAFAESSNLSKHIRVHTGARPFVCSECGSGFARPDGLERHRKVHRRQREREQEKGKQKAGRQMAAKANQAAARGQ